MRASLDSPIAILAVLFAVVSTAVVVTAAVDDAPAVTAEPTAPATPAPTTPATPTPATPPGPATSAVVQTQQVNFNNALRDFYSQYEWMVAQIDFTVRNNLNPEGNRRWAENVEVMLTIGWGTKSATAPQLDLALTSSIRLVGVEVNRQSTVFFFVPPEVLQRGVRNGTPLSARAAPSFYVVQYSINGQAVVIARGDVSGSLPDARWWNGFLEAAKAKLGTRGLLMNEAEVPPYVLSGALGRMNAGQPVPTFFRDSAR